MYKKTPPIPLCVLPHNAKIKNKTANGIFSEFDNTEIPVSRIRVELCEKAVQQKNSGVANNRKNAVMYYDTINSRPKGLSFKTGRIIEYEGVNYTITAVDAVMDNSSVHHYRIELS